jgi:hypothetical protein
VNEMMELVPTISVPESIVSMQERKGVSGLSLYYKTLQDSQTVTELWEGLNRLVDDQHFIIFNYFILFSFNQGMVTSTRSMAFQCVSLPSLRAK